MNKDEEPAANSSDDNNNQTTRESAAGQSEEEFLLRRSIVLQTALSDDDEDTYEDDYDDDTAAADGDDDNNNGKNTSRHNQDEKEKSIAWLFSGDVNNNCNKNDDTISERKKRIHDGEAAEKITVAQSEADLFARKNSAFLTVSPDDVDDDRVEGKEKRTGVLSPADDNSEKKPPPSEIVPAGLVSPKLMSPPSQQRQQPQQLQQQQQQQQQQEELLRTISLESMPPPPSCCSIVGGVGSPGAFHVRGIGVEIAQENNNTNENSNNNSNHPGGGGDNDDVEAQSSLSSAPGHAQPQQQSQNHQQPQQDLLVEARLVDSERSSLALSSGNNSNRNVNPFGGSSGRRGTPPVLAHAQPLLEEEKNTWQAVLMNPRVWIILCVVVVVVICIAAGVSVGISTQDKYDITTDLTSIQQELFDDSLPQSTIDAIFQAPNTPQARANQWMLEDKNLTTYSRARQHQRFGLVAFFYATGGEKWRNPGRWLDYSVNECEWGVLLRRPKIDGKLL